MKKAKQWVKQRTGWGPDVSFGPESSSEYKQKVEYDKKRELERRAKTEENRLKGLKDKHTWRSDD